MLPDFDEFMKIVNTEYYDFVLDEFRENEGYNPIYSGYFLMDNGYEGLHPNCWYFCKDWFHDSPCEPLSGANYNEAFEMSRISFLEHHQYYCYFDDFADCSWEDVDPRFYKELSKFFTGSSRKLMDDPDYSCDIAWLLDDFAYQYIFPKLFKKLQNTYR